MYQVPELYSRRRRLELHTPSLDVSAARSALAGREAGMLSPQLSGRQRCSPAPPLPLLGRRTYSPTKTKPDQWTPQAQWGLRLGAWYWKDDTKTLEFKRNKSLDIFLMALLYYLSHYLEKNSLEKKPKSYMVGLVEKKEMELVSSKLEEAQKYLAKKYCVLLLGLDMPDKHHMCCGRDKMSDTQKDWKFFESFFTFCTHVAWIVFRRQHLTEIEEEIGRLFRTNMFNIPRRRHEDEESGGERKRMTLVQFRRMMAKRPAIKKAINMRSPVVSTLLPSLREKAQNIAEKKYQGGERRSGYVGKHMSSQDSVPLPVVGILGEPRYLFNPHTLLPIDPEENAKASGRNSSLIEINVRIQDTMDLAMRSLSQTSCLK
ncbi:PREDICTED: protein phosphatase 1 regulatory subunit 36 isoform X3 [Chinchilla lanigera]|uniref:protein phosphatase 1 regulatory subunit 36 isoform X3 n=1 Tax=Chinchilla lanigera TaxID=34839 RepID=UPI0006982658|nr:PREDICTED: protein phosphatase 1 regulatory subunit 36 isoform X3 [Chinchilla lanigera]